MSGSVRKRGGRCRVVEKFFNNSIASAVVVVVVVVVLVVVGIGVVGRVVV